jgi:DNA-binding transcriptional MerR regulator
MATIVIGGLPCGTRTLVATIRYYESIGLLPQAARTQAGQRQFDAPDTARLQVINSRRALGFSIKAVKGLLRDAGPGTANCNSARDAVKAQQATVRVRVRARLAEPNRIEAQVSPSCALVLERVSPTAP